MFYYLVLFFIGALLFITMCVLISFLSEYVRVDYANNDFWTFLSHRVRDFAFAASFGK